MENSIRLDNNVLVCVEPIVSDEDRSEYLYLRESFCGRVLDSAEETFDTLNPSSVGARVVIYACGNASRLHNIVKSLPNKIKAIREFSHDFEGVERLEIVSLGEVPLNVNGAAVYYRNYLGHRTDDKNYFDLLRTKHRFQSLTESNKPGTSFRKGAYLSEVEMDGSSSKFHLLRCSTNLGGPTLAFADEDREILSKVNDLARQHFDQPTNLNHVLVQVYENSVTMSEGEKVKEHKAKIKSHSDKTKDMPTNGLIAFCTFYSSDINTYKSPSHDQFDRNFKGASVLTRLRFRLKDSAKGSHFDKDFCVTLYPNSILLIPLSTNRFFTHEIVPSMLPVGRFPTRMGYVVRCSKTKAVFENGATFIEREIGERIPLKRPTKDEFAALKRLYQEENVLAEMVSYPDIWFSMNEGDFQRPQVE